MRRLVLPVGLLVATTAAAISQDVVPITPPVEQRIEMLTTDEVQAVEPLAEGEAQAVMQHEPPSAGARTASTVGKAAAGVAAAVISVGIMAASLLFI